MLTSGDKLPQAARPKRIFRGMLSHVPRNERLFTVTNTFLLTLVLILMIYPLWYVVVSSLSSPTAVVQGQTYLLPRGLRLDAYRRVFQYSKILTAYKNTIVYTVLGTAINLVLSFMTAFPLSRRDLYGRSAITKIFSVSLFFQGGIIPTYLIVRNLGLYDSMWALLLIPAISMWNVIIMRTFLETSIPFELQEAALIDGCSNIQILLRIILPLSMPIVSVMIIYYGVAHWNSYFRALIYLSSEKKYPLMLVLRQLLVMEEMQDMVGSSTGDTVAFADQLLIIETMKYALMVVASLPVICLYPFLQKHFAKGVMVGAVKG